MKTAYLTAGLVYGDEGKGATVDFLCQTRQAGLVVRYNGGPQAAHNVVTPDGLHHTFSQFGSGTFRGAKTHLSQHMLINPISMMAEEKHLREVGVNDAFELLTVDPRCVVITPFHRAINRLEKIASGSHNSCGSGLGHARADHLEYGSGVLFASDLKNEDTTKQKLRFLQKINREKSRAIDSRSLYSDNAALLETLTLIDPAAVDWCWEHYRSWPAKVPGAGYLKYLLKWEENVVFEGAQGVLLDEKCGDPGYNTWTNTTFDNAFNLLIESGYDGDTVKIGVIRSYCTRHGEGPFPTEDQSLSYPEPHNDGYGYQGKFRLGHLDANAINKAINICDGVDGLAVNHLDIQANLPESLVEGKILIKGHGPTSDDREWIL